MKPERERGFLEPVIDRINFNLSKSSVRGKPYIPMLLHNAQIVTEGDFTMVGIVANSNTGGRTFYGFAKRNPMDKPNKKIGVMTAFNRALKNYVRFWRPEPDTVEVVK